VSEVVHRYDGWYTSDRRRFGKLLLREVDDLWGGADSGVDIFLLDLLNFSQSALKVLYLFPESRYLVPLNRILALSNDGRFFHYRALLRPPFALSRIIRRG